MKTQLPIHSMSALFFGALASIAAAGDTSSIATGGEVSLLNSDTEAVHAFTNAGTYSFTLSSGCRARILLVGGGGGGGYICSGGGGGGGMIDTNNVTLQAGTYTVTVGAGGQVELKGTQRAEMVATPSSLPLEARKFQGPMVVEAALPTPRILQLQKMASPEEVAAVQHPEGVAAPASLGRVTPGARPVVPAPLAAAARAVLPLLTQLARKRAAEQAVREGRATSPARKCTTAAAAAAAAGIAPALPHR